MESSFPSLRSHLDHEHVYLPPSSSTGTTTGQYSYSDDEDNIPAWKTNTSATAVASVGDYDYDGTGRMDKSLLWLQFRFCHVDVADIDALETYLRRRPGIRGLALRSCTFAPAAVEAWRRFLRQHQNDNNIVHLILAPLVVPSVASRQASSPQPPAQPHSTWQLLPPHLDIQTLQLRLPVVSNHLGGPWSSTNPSFAGDHNQDDDDDDGASLVRKSSSRTGDHSRMYAPMVSSPRVLSTWHNLRHLTLLDLDASPRQIRQLQWPLTITTLRLVTCNLRDDSVAALLETLTAPTTVLVDRLDMEEDRFGGLSEASMPTICQLLRHHVRHRFCLSGLTQLWSSPRTPSPALHGLDPLWETLSQPTVTLTHLELRSITRVSPDFLPGLLQHLASTCRQQPTSSQPAIRLRSFVYDDCPCSPWAWEVLCRTLPHWTLLQRLHFQPTRSRGEVQSSFPAADQLHRALEANTSLWEFSGPGRTPKNSRWTALGYRNRGLTLSHDNVYDQSCDLKGRGQSLCLLWPHAWQVLHRHQRNHIDCLATAIYQSLQQAPPHLWSSADRQWEIAEACAMRDVETKPPF